MVLSIGRGRRWARVAIAFACVLPALIACAANDAPPAGKSGYKLDSALTRLNVDRGRDFVGAAQEHGLLFVDHGVLVQLAHAGSEAALLDQLRSLGISVRDSYPRYRRIDVVITGFDDLDALQALDAVERIEALRKPVRR